MTGLDALRQIGAARVPPKEWGEVASLAEIAEALDASLVTVSRKMKAAVNAVPPCVRGGRYKHGRRTMMVYALADVLREAKRGRL